MQSIRTLSAEAPVVLGTKIAVAADTVTTAGLMVATWIGLANSQVAVLDAETTLFLWGTVVALVVCSIAVGVGLSWGKTVWLHAAVLIGFALLAFSVWELWKLETLQRFGLDNRSSAFAVLGVYHLLHLLGALVLVARAARGASDSERQTIAGWWWFSMAFWGLVFALTFLFVG